MCICVCLYLCICVFVHLCICVFVYSSYPMDRYHPQSSYLLLLLSSYSGHQARGGGWICCNFIKFNKQIKKSLTSTAKSLNLLQNPTEGFTVYTIHLEFCKNLTCIKFRTNSVVILVKRKRTRRNKFQILGGFQR